MLDDPILLNDWYVAARASELEPGAVRSVRLLEQDLVLWRSGRSIHAWLDLCVHRGAKLSGGQVRDDCRVCPYHAWTYSEEGRCTRIPAHSELTPPTKARATTYAVEERYDLIWVCLGTPARPVPAFPEWDDATFRKVHCGPYAFSALGPRVVENFLDVGHLPIVHGGLLGDASRPEIQDYTAEVTSEGVIARDIRLWQPDPDGFGNPGEAAYT